MKREDILRRAPNISQIAGIRRVILDEGKGRGMGAYEVKTGGGLNFTVHADRCMDIFEASYRGVNLGFLSKNGAISPNFFENSEKGFLNYVQGGFLFTCGFRNVGPACTVNGELHPAHGRASVLPAENVFSRCYWQGNEYKMTLGGNMRESTLFGHNLVLSRTISTSMGSNSFEINDILQNDSPELEKIMILYHLNFGYPVLSAAARLEIDSEMTPRDDEAKKGITEYKEFTGPIDGYNEQCFYHKMNKPAAALVNPEAGLRVLVEYDKTNLPNFTEWKSMRSGDYALGVEPANCFPEGREAADKAGRLVQIEPFGKLEYKLKVTVEEI